MARITRFLHAAAIGVVALYWIQAGATEPFAIVSVRLDPARKPQLGFPGNTNTYYVLYRGLSATNITQPVKLVLGQTGTNQVVDDSAPTSGTAFYRVAEMETANPGDVDRDGIDDIYELEHPSDLNPLNPADADQDPDGDGRNNYREYLGGTDLNSRNLTLSPVVIAVNQTLNCDSTNLVGRDVIIDGATVTIGCILRVNSLTLTNGAVLTGVAGSSSGLRVTAAGALYVSDNGSRIDVTSLGFSSGEGPGSGPAREGYGPGGSHGGMGTKTWSGNWPSGVTYGSFTQPTTLGSGGQLRVGGFGRRGGGAIRLVVGERLTVIGSILSNGGTAATAGAGAGGSIWITAGELVGGGAILARGGDGLNGNSSNGWDGAGGGGRIAVYFRTNSFGGTISACGGVREACCNALDVERWGGAGTVWLQQANAKKGMLIVGGCDTGGHGIQPTQMDGDVTITGDLIVRSGGLLAPPHGSTNFHLNVMGNATIEDRGAISAVSRGFYAGQGPGSGASQASYGAGGSHGGVGTKTWNSEWPSYLTYGSITEPTTLGSGGRLRDNGWGRYGGGVIRLNVGGTLTIQSGGSVDANGGKAALSGAGAGGSVWITAGKLAGGGSISARGGDAENANSSNGWDGAGGGGRVAVYYGTNEFSGQIVACGGYRSACCNAVDLPRWAGAGSIWMQKNNESFGTLIVDSCDNGNEGVEPMQLSGENAITGNLVVRRSGWIAPPWGDTNFHLRVQGDVTVEDRGIISAANRGYYAGEGPGSGASQNSYGAGGSHGGVGSKTWSGNWPQHTTYGSITEPNTLGSGGRLRGGGWGRWGGGVVRMTVDGALIVLGSGSVNADGGVAGASGAGAGGSLWILADRIAGDGTISARGGDAQNANGSNGWDGSGGGGRVAVYYRTNEFVGIISAAGGLRATCCDDVGYPRAGGAGTVYLKSASAPLGVLFLDNAGNRGEASPLDPSGLTEFSSLWVRSGAVLSHSYGQSNFNLRIYGDMTVTSGGLVDVSGRGHPPGAGPATGSVRSGSSIGGGGGHGGAGGASSDGGSGGGIYGSNLEPIDFGSGGGRPEINGGGGWGGGVIRMVVDGTLQVDGAIRSNGDAAGNGGAGAGGSIWLVARNVRGGGSIQANGGAGFNGNGGGGGGRVAIYSRCFPETNSMTIQAVGGNGGGRNGSVFFGVQTGTNTVTTFVTVNSRDTYLRVNDDPNAGFSVPIDLAALGIKPCDTLRLRRIGDYQYEPPVTNSLTYLFGVFSRTSELLSPSVQQRVSDAIPANLPPVLTLPTLEGSLPTDISEDFRIENELVTVPENGRYLFLSPHDYFFGDNLDPEGDYRIEITRYLYEPTSP